MSKMLKPTPEYIVEYFACGEKESEIGIKKEWEEWLIYNASLIIDDLAHGIKNQYVVEN